MLHLWMIALFAALMLHDAAPGAVLHGLSPLLIIAATLGPFVLVALVVHTIMFAVGRDLDARGSWRSVALAERTLAASRLLCVLWHAVSILLLGFLDLVRSALGDLILLDEIAALLPAVAVFAAGWWSFYPIERRLRDATLMRTLDAGGPMYPTPTRSQWVLSNVRHQVLLTLVPLSIIGAWTETLGILVHRSLVADQSGDAGLFAAIGLWLRTHPWSDLAINAAQLAGAALIFALSPLILRLVWDTVPLGEGSLRARLMDMLRDRGVRVRELLVWRTHGAMVNGAVMGLVGPARYILLTDALLDHLPSRQVEAVMAHEIGHARLAHVPWLVGTLIAAMGAMQFLGAIAMSLLHAPETTGLGAQALGSGLTLGFPILLIVGAAFAFGFVSRRFEWQADAFAAKQLSVLPPQSTEAAPTDNRVTAEAVASMAGALDSVARLNHIPRNQKSFRHGSIALRQAKLHALVGQPLTAVSIDRTARAIKIAVTLGLAMVLGMVAWEVHAISTAPIPPHHAPAPLGAPE